MNYQDRLKEAKGIYAQGLHRVATTPVPENQKFAPGTFVMLAADLGDSMRHFPNNRPARVECTYAHAYIWGNPARYSKEYRLLVRRDDGSWSNIAWYHESQLTEISDTEAIKGYLKEIG